MLKLLSKYMNPIVGNCCLATRGSLTIFVHFILFFNYMVFHSSFTTELTRSSILWLAPSTKSFCTSSQNIYKLV